MPKIKVTSIINTLYIFFSVKKDLQCRKNFSQLLLILHFDRVSISKRVMIYLDVFDLYIIT